MPVSMDVWRMRVGKFKMPPSKLSRKLGLLQHLQEWQSDVSAPPASVLICCLVTLVMRAHPVVNQPCTPDANHGFEMDDNHSFIPYFRVNLLLAGDVETNPGPTPLFSEDDIQTLRSGEVLVEKPSPLLNKHIIQLNQLKKKYKSITWGDIKLWLAQLMDKQVTELPSESTIQSQWNRLTIEKRTLGKSGRKNPENLEEWQESQYTLPVPKGPLGPRQSITSRSLLDVQAMQDANVDLAKEVKHLTDEKETLSKQRPSPHKCKLMIRREKRHQKLMKQQHNSLTKLSKELQKKEKKTSSLKKKKRSLSLEKDGLQKKIRKLDKPKPQDPAKATLEEKLETAQYHILELQEINAELQRKLQKKESNVVTLLAHNDKGHLCYSAEARECVYKLLSLRLGFDSVGKAMKAVLGLVGKTADKLPSGRTVSHMNDERLQKLQRQIKELSDKPNVTLASTDDTTMPPTTD